MGRGSGRVRRSNPFHLLSDRAGRYVFLHLLAFALLWLAMKSPILGKPKRQLSGAVHRFSAHLRAYASLLYRSGDRRHAEDLISTYEKPGAPHE
ncbi:MAG: hypothetical protein ACI8W8_004418 [Rhodothermales bacterium]|jgi:hypothetical protein